MPPDSQTQNSRVSKTLTNNNNWGGINWDLKVINKLLYEEIIIIASENIFSMIQRVQDSLR